MGCLAASNTSSSELNTAEVPVMKAGAETDAGVSAAKTGKSAERVMDTNNLTETSNAEKKEGTVKDIPFEEEYVRVVNELRRNPPAFAEKVDQHMNYIMESEKEPGKLVYCVKKGQPTINLKEGKQPFYDVIEILKNMNPLPEVQFREDLKIPIKEEEPTIWAKKEGYSDAFNEKKSEKKYLDYKFYFDIGYPTAESAVILQVVDDPVFKNQRRKNILNGDLTNIGVSSFKGKGKFVSYYLFAK